MSKNIRKRREKLWNEEGGKCHWCSRETSLPPKGEAKVIPTPDLATLDHLRTRLDKNRQEPNVNNEQRTLLACWQCNNLRGRLHQLVTMPMITILKVNNEVDSNNSIPQ